MFLVKQKRFIFLIYTKNNYHEAYYYSVLRAIGASEWQANYFAKLLNKNRPTSKELLLKLVHFFYQHFPEGHHLMIGIIRYTLMRFQENKDFTLKGRTAQSISRDSIDFYKDG